MAENVVYSDASRNKPILEYVVANGRIPPWLIATIGMMRGEGRRVGKMLEFDFSMTGDSLYRTGEMMLVNAERLMSQRKRKVTDILMTMDSVLGLGERISLQLNMSFHPYAEKFEEMLKRLYNIKISLERISKQNLSITLEEAAKEDVKISDSVELIYNPRYREMAEMAKQMLEENNEFKEKIDENFLTDLLINVPIVTVEQVWNKDFPSDYQEESK
jgi:hypothetical protein